MKQNLRTQFYKICVICGLLKICANLREMKSYETKPACCLKSKTALTNGQSRQNIQTAVFPHLRSQTPYIAEP